MDRQKKAGSGRWDREKMQKTHATSHVNEPIPHSSELRQPCRPLPCREEGRRVVQVVRKRTKVLFFSLHPEGKKESGLKT